MTQKTCVILGAGFGGLELSRRLVDALGDQIEITLIDKNDGFVFGFLKFDLMLGQASLPEVTFYYRLWHTLATTSAGRVGRSFG